MASNSKVLAVGALRKQLTALRIRYAKLSANPHKNPALLKKVDAQATQLVRQLEKAGINVNYGVGKPLPMRRYRDRRTSTLRLQFPKGSNPFVAQTRPGRVIPHEKPRRIPVPGLVAYVPKLAAEKKAAFEPKHSDGEKVFSYRSRQGRTKIDPEVPFPKKPPRPPGR